MTATICPTAIVSTPEPALEPAPSGPRRRRVVPGAAWKRQHHAGLDGLRAVAVVGVLCYHSAFGWARGGFLGVEVFFVLSGYLITSILVAEWDEDGRIAVGLFWRRRARRLLPAVAALLVVTSLVLVVGMRNDLARFRGDVVAASTYVSNWWQILRHQSYFEQLGRPPMLQHLWSLAIEEQFYLLWPLLLIFGLRRCGRRSQRLVVPALALVALSTLWMAHSAHAVGDTSRAYFGTDTRAAGLLTGAAFALWWKPSRLSARLARSARFVLDLVGVAGFVLLVWLFIHLSEFDPQLYRGGFLVTDLATVGVIAAVVHPASRLVNEVLGRRMLRWIGTRSYGIYLWHWPVFVMSRPHADVQLTGWPLFGLRVAVTCLAAEASYRLVERRYRPAPRPVGDHPAFRVMTPVTATPRRPSALALVLAGSAVIGLIWWPGWIPRIGSAPSTAEAARGSQQLQSPARSAFDPPLRRRVGLTSAVTTVPAPRIVTQHAVVAVGDSVLIDAASALTQRVADIEVDGRVGRQFSEGFNDFQLRQASGRLGRQVIVALGTNGIVTAGQFDDLMRLLDGVERVVVVNVSVPRSWQDPVNRVLADGVHRWPSAVLVNWNTAIAAHPSWVYSDGVHLRPEAVSLYADLVASALTTTN